MELLDIFLFPFFFENKDIFICHIFSQGRFSLRAFLSIYAL